MQYERLKIVIPSHRRADRVISKRLFISPIICVEESQKDEYMKFNPECTIVTHPDSVKGLVQKRNWICENIGDCFMVDDDVIGANRLFVKPGEKQGLMKGEVEDYINFVYRLAIMLDINLFVFSQCTNPSMFDQGRWFVLNKPITGCAYGIRKSKNIHWDERFTLKEDFLVSSRIMFTERKILTCQLIHFDQKSTGVNPGGLSSIRNKDEIKRNILLLRKMYGESIRLKGKGFGNEKEEFNIVANYKI